ncbi:MAG: CDP-diacylglycerol--glycerol-3-phosphate 3-phosphatidyltransferase [Actinomycetota bacterium]
MKPFGSWPNTISVFRIALVPVLLALLLTDSRTAHYVAAAVFVVAAATDVLDGYLARRHKMTTVTGQWLDPLSDKLLVLAPILLLTVQGEFPIWGTIIIVVREVAVSGLRLYVGNRRASMPASDIAKAKTVSQTLAITLYLLPGVPTGIRIGVLILAVALTVYSGIDYFLRVRSVIGATK